jgi:hypothetical protein
MGIDCDPRGRIYVCDAVNNRIQVYGGDAAHLKTIQVERPYLVQVHRKTGAIYVLQIGRVGGRSVCQFAKLASLDNPAVEYRVEVPNYSVLALDHWSAPPRFWMGGGSVGEGGNWEVKGGGPSVRLFEERGGGLKLLADFDGEAAKAGGAGYMGRWGGGEQGGSGIGGKLNCDPVRGVAYYGSAMFDLKTGALLGSFKIAGSTYDDFSFDRRGRMHIHFNPGFYMPGVGRVDPSRARESVDQQTGRKVFLYPEMPYDYGEERTGKWETPWKGILPVRDQPGAKFFQDGIGVDMTGNVAVESNIYYVPRMEETGFETVVAGMDEKGRREEPQTGDYSFEKFMRDIQDREKRGEEVYSIRRQPGVPLHGATIWTFDQAGELREKCAATLGNLVNGVRIDEAGRLYFVNNRPRIVAGKGFLNGRGGMFGVPDEKRNRSLGFMAGPFTGTLAKTAGRDVRAVAMKAAVPLDQPIERPGDVCGGYSEDEKMWIEGAEWLYAGASPIVYGGCSCPTQRFHLDWFKRSFVPEGYRHSIGVLDANGNLIMHIGRYGNYDSGFGPKSRIPVGGDQIGMIQARFISGTDDCLAFTDWCERIVVLALNYHAEESAPVGAQ